MPTIEQQRQGLQNFADRFGFTIGLYVQNDNRKNTLFFVNDGRCTISPNMDYNNTNHFLLGYLRATDKNTIKNF